ncbi:TauD/TfdA family dioxygenase [Streptomyces sp. HU2014]|uniref:Putative taurine catabolism dioxygenase n=1 Tax=Streptomyces albireticuli TaxID=1940 RepID=A0A1Z2LBM3_9ACTN|nr:MULTISPECIES: TauD/TfdA family dioxygenase [Streptomyces]ARZ71720.1 putative taurine catabolism dioxygenase [Streptomyces albireticuli]UQI45162.1 TauD/TfdA family dioxygenase [Streptomyces sp. HU2014]
MDTPVAVAGPSVWQGATLKERDWLIPVPRPLPGGATGDAPPGQKGADPAARAAQYLNRGPGLAVVRGLGLDTLTDEECVAVCGRFMAPLGDVRPVNPDHPGDNLVTAAAAAPAPPARAHHPGEDLALHTDRAKFPGPPRLLGMLCIRPARHGGESVLVSGHAVHNALLRSRPDVLPDLYQDFHFGRGPDFEHIYPVFRRSAGSLHVQYNRYWITRGHREHGIPLSPAQVAALNAFDEVLADPRMALRVRLRRGDLLLVDNTAVLHGRTSFADPPPPHAGRCLVRVWAD